MIIEASFSPDLGAVTRLRFSGLLSNQGKKYKELFHKGSFKKKVLKYGTPKPSLYGLCLYKLFGSIQAV